MASRQFGGRQAQAFGKLFERLFERTAKREGLLAIQIKDGGRQVSKTKFIREKTALDWVVFNGTGLVLCIDTKTYAKEKNLCRSDLSEHQVQYLYAIGERGNRAGYLVWFRSSKNVIFFNSKILHGIWNTGESCSPDQGVFIGEIENFRVNQLFGMRALLEDPMSAMSSRARNEKQVEIDPQCESEEESEPELI